MERTIRKLDNNFRIKTHKHAITRPCHLETAAGRKAEQVRIICKKS